MRPAALARRAAGMHAPGQPVIARNRLACGEADGPGHRALDCVTCGPRRIYVMDI